MRKVTRAYTYDKSCAADETEKPITHGSGELSGDAARWE